MKIRSVFAKRFFFIHTKTFIFNYKIKIMKSILLLLGTLMLNLTVAAQKIQESKVPTAVLISFKTKFHDATKTSWEIENNSEYEAEFLIDRTKQSAKFAKSGKWLKTKSEINTDELPKEVSQTITKEFAGFKIEKAEKADTLNNGTVYEVIVKKDMKTYDVTIAASGKTLRKVIKK